MFVDEGAESQAVPEGRGHVGDGHIPVALTLDPAPLLQSLHGRHPRPQSPHRPVRERRGSAVAVSELLLTSPPSTRRTSGSFPQELWTWEVRLSQTSASLGITLFSSADTVEWK